MNKHLVCLLCSNFLTKSQIPADVAAGRRVIKQEVKVGELLHADDRVQQTDDWNRVKEETCNKGTKSKMTNCFKCACRDREIQFYDLSTLDPYCQINALETIPLTLSHRWALSLLSFIVICKLS